MLQARSKQKQAEASESVESLSPDYRIPFGNLEFQMLSVLDSYLESGNVVFAGAP